MYVNASMVQLIIGLCDCDQHLTIRISVFYFEAMYLPTK